MRTVFLALLVLLVATGVAAAAPAAGGSAATQQYVLVFNGNAVPSGAAAAVQRAGGTIVRTLPQVGLALAESSNARFASTLRAPQLAAVTGHYAHTLPPLANEPAQAVTPGAFWGFQWNIRRVQAEDAWTITSGSRDTVVSIIDTGVASNHPDLAANIVYMDCRSSTGVCSAYPDQHWHGTHVAGTAAANGTVGVLGVGPHLGIASYNVFEFIPGCGICAFDFPIWEAMIDSAEKGWEVINMSLGGYDDFSNGREAAETWTAWNRVANWVTNRGTTIVASAGNGDVNLNGSLYHIPSDLPDVISVMATSIRPLPAYPQPGFWDVRAFYSNYGAAVTLAAPGGDCGVDDSCDPATRPPNWFHYLVLSSFVQPNPACAAAMNCPVGWAFAGGTSMASPHVTGAAGLLKEHKPQLNPRQVRSTLMRTAEDIGPRLIFGHGMVDAYAALTR